LIFDGEASEGGKGEMDGGQVVVVAGEGFEEGSGSGQFGWRGRVGGEVERGRGDGSYMIAAYASISQLFDGAAAGGAGELV
jgi:hypothetical protein